MNLFELTEQESGILIYGKSVIVCNWSSLTDDSIPKVLDPVGIINWPTDSNAISYMRKTKRRIDNIRSLIPDHDTIDIVYDYNDDLSMIYSSDPIPGDVYDLPDGGILIAPEGWC